MPTSSPGVGNANDKAESAGSGCGACPLPRPFPLLAGDAPVRRVCQIRRSV